MNGQIQYGSARAVTSVATHHGRAHRVAEPGRFQAGRLGRPLAVWAGIGVVLAILLVAIPRELPGPAVLMLVGGAWVALMLAMTLPSRAERAGEELAARLARFRHAVNAIGDAPTRDQLEGVLTLARSLELREEEIADDATRVRASLAALTLRDEIALGRLPIVETGSALPCDDVCHFLAAVRFGRRRSDLQGQLLLTRDWLKFSGASDLSVAWTQVDEVQRAGPDLVVTLDDRGRGYRFSFRTAEEAARAGVLAAHLCRTGA